jgi:hypothetical protein
VPIARLAAAQATIVEKMESKGKKVSGDATK